MPTVPYALSSLSSTFSSPSCVPYYRFCSYPYPSCVSSFFFAQHHYLRMTTNWLNANVGAVGRGYGCGHDFVNACGCGIRLVVVSVSDGRHGLSVVRGNVTYATAQASRVFGLCAASGNVNGVSSLPHDFCRSSGPC